VGALIVKDRRILCTGYNGTPTNIEHCDITGCLRDKLKIPPGERHELCLLPDEKVFTDKGYISIDKVAVGRRVLTHKNFYRKVSQTFKRKYNDSLYFIEPWHLLPVALTPNHPVLAIKTQRCQFDSRTLCKETCRSVNNQYCAKPYLTYQPEWIPANRLNVRDLVLLSFDSRSFSTEHIDFSFVSDAPLSYSEALARRSCGKTFREIQEELDIYPSRVYNWENGGAPRGAIIACAEKLKHGSSPSRTIPVKVPITNSLLRIIGFYLAEGCSSSNQVSFSFHQKEKECIKEVIDSMGKIFGLDCYENKRKNVHNLVFSSVILAKAFKGLFGEGSHSKKVPDFLMKLPPEQQKHILTSYAQGDGYKPDKNTTIVTTASETLAFQVVRILLRLGYTPIIDTGRNMHRVIWKESKKAHYGYIKNSTFFTPIRKIWTEKYTGYVYNLSVEKDNSYTTKSFTVHNCRGLHAEQNAFLQAACYGINVKGATIYCTTQPCVICAKMIINAGIKEVVIKEGYPDQMARDFFKKANIKLRRLKRR